MTICELMSLLPSKKEFERDIPISEAGPIGFCGDFEYGKKVHKLLTREGYMLTYHQMGDRLQYVATSRLH